MRIVIITGGNSGLGRKTAEKIAKNKEYTVILVLSEFWVLCLKQVL